ncbi:MAG: OmpH family outer membrane protein [Pyrinomonadaceae bacterium]|nr:OmpH family outer membrane protein [Pyrinomonadaceae bacterium]MCX7639151.1 OmpH family outer membrane protein [Pyrinomonadaceae bacterium]MDW8303628.1 OmpH family outer membrane protein [Acidobacteriota bacterium]
MKNLIIFAAVLIILSAVPAISQTPSGTKIAVINTLAFDDEKTGITKYVNALNALDREFQPVKTELQTLASRIDSLTKEYNTLLEQANKPNSPVSPQTLQAKREEIEKLQREAKFKQEDANAKYQSRYNTVVGPILQDIMKAMQEYAKQKGYALIFDAARLDEGQLILAVGDEKIDVTKDFITFYNARQTTSTTTTNPQR